MSRPVFLIFLLIPSSAMAQAVSPDDRTRQLVEHARRLVAVDADGCLLHRTNDEIVVCGTPEIDRQQRLPFPGLETKPGERIREPLPKANPEIIQQGRCYVTMDERNCFKGVSLVKVSFGGAGGSGGGAAGRLWNVIDPEVPDEDYVRQAMVRPLSPEQPD
ncbi:hypothetical protein [uncultured Parasphingorhabdus sp.]|uniref:hypothetical protein n=1 Tax=uncultured Parasphingorhabdus sp. TaxID=2709694 RepID=UPI0030DD1E3D|tara:strand:- start:4064 stop:4546 length:483 start_codon:yes stop_codon:yes gene_type:complete